MTWQPKTPKQSGFADLDFSRWTDEHPPKPAAKRGSAPAPVRPRYRDVVDKHGWVRLSAADQEMYARMKELHRRVEARVAKGEERGAALAAVKRELWPDEYRGD